MRLEAPDPTRGLFALTVNVQMQGNSLTVLGFRPGVLTAIIWDSTVA